MIYIYGLAFHHWKTGQLQLSSTIATEFCIIFFCC